jgi:hypothetical protein
VSDPEAIAGVRVNPSDGERWPFAGEDETREERHGASPLPAPEREIERPFICEEAASFASVVSRDLSRVVSGSLAGFVSFEDFLVRFGAFAAHYQGRDDPDMTDRATGAAFEVRTWMMA